MQTEQLVTIVRPGPVRWLGYAFGARLPERHRDWVFRDVTARGWQLRHMLRTTVALAPFVVVLALVLPGDPWTRVLAGFGGLLMGWFYGFAYMDAATEHRAVKAGFEPGAATEAREAPHAAEVAERQERYARRWRHDDTEG